MFIIVMGCSVGNMKSSAKSRSHVAEITLKGRDKKPSDIGVIGKSGWSYIDRKSIGIACEIWLPMVPNASRECKTSPESLGMKATNKIKTDSTVLHNRELSGACVVGSISIIHSENGKKESLAKLKVTLVQIVIDVTPVKNMIARISQAITEPNVLPHISINRLTLGIPVFIEEFP